MSVLTFGVTHDTNSSESQVFDQSSLSMLTLLLFKLSPDQYQTSGTCNFILEIHCGTVTLS